jgi:hypothetical protein
MRLICRYSLLWNVAEHPMTEPANRDSNTGCNDEFSSTLSHVASLRSLRSRRSDAIIHRAFYRAIATNALMHPAKKMMQKVPNKFGAKSRALNKNTINAV